MCKLMDDITHDTARRAVQNPPRPEYGWVRALAPLAGCLIGPPLPPPPAALVPQLSPKIIKRTCISSKKNLYCTLNMHFPKKKK